MSRTLHTPQHPVLLLFLANWTSSLARDLETVFIEELPPPGGVHGQIRIDATSILQLPLQTHQVTVLPEYRQYRKPCYQTEEDCGLWVPAIQTDTPSIFVIQPISERPVEVRFQLQLAELPASGFSRRRRQSNAVTMMEDSVPLTVHVPLCKYNCLPCLVLEFTQLYALFVFGIVL